MKTQLPESVAEAAVLAAVEARAPGRTLCPSEVARGLAEDWRPLMGPVRDAAARLAARGLVAVTQRGVAVDPLTARGPIRLGRPIPPRA
jgi:hypothetical protein